MSNSAIEFPTSTRIHIALGVRDISAARAFYETLFGQPPTKVREGYAGPVDTHAGLAWSWP